MTATLMETNDTAIKKYGITVFIEDVTPDAARSWLEAALPNRRIRPHFVQRLADDIRGGFWTLNGAPIRFDTNGRLVDGQHRLSAIALAGITVPSVIVTDVPAEAHDTIDQGMARKFADILKIRGEKYYSVLAAATAWRENYETGTIGINRAQLSPARLTARLNSAPTLRDGAEWFTHVQQDCPIIPSQAVFAYSLFGEISTSDRDAFLESVTTGAELEAENPAFVLRNALLRERAKSQGKRSPMVQLAWIIKSWNAYRDSDRTLKHLKWAPWKEEFPVAR